MEINLSTGEKSQRLTKTLYTYVLLKGDCYKSTKVTQNATEHLLPIGYEIVIAVGYIYIFF